METTNEMLKITAEYAENFGYFIFAMAAVYLVYAMIMREYFRQKKKKINEIKRIIEDGHSRMLREENNK